MEKVAENWSDWSGAHGLVREMTEPAAFQSKLTGVIMYKLMDDGVVVVRAKHWTELWLQWVDFSCRNFLGDCWSTQSGVSIQVTPLETLFDSLLSSTGLGSCAPVPSPAARSEMRVSKEEPPSGSAEHQQNRTFAVKLMDIQFCFKVCAGGVKDPSARDMQRAKRPHGYS